MVATHALRWLTTGIKITSSEPQPSHLPRASQARKGRGVTADIIRPESIAPAEDKRRGGQVEEFSLATGLATTAFLNSFGSDRVLGASAAQMLLGGASSKGPCVPCHGPIRMQPWPTLRLRLEPWQARQARR